MSAKRVLAGICVLVLGILACNLQGDRLQQPDLPGTITAQALTLQAPAETPPGPAQAEEAGVEVSVSSDTNCRTGPAQAFDLTFTASPGQKFKVVGKNTETGYWIIENPTGGTCWLWGQYAIITGDKSILPEYPSPALPTPGPTKTPKATKTPKDTNTPEVSNTAPNAPSGVSGPRTCEGYMDGFTPKWREKVSLTWQDNSSNEVGFGIWQNGLLLGKVLADVTSYQAEFTYNQGTGGQLFDTFGVESYNVAGISSRPVIDVPRCP
jgi:hypothetical protein